MYLLDNYFVLPRYKCCYQMSVHSVKEKLKMPWQICGVFSSHALGDMSEVAVFAQSIRYKYMHASVQ